MFLNKFQMKRYSNISAIAGGSVATFLIGLILSPMVSIVFDKYFHIFETGGKYDDMIVAITLILWVLIASISGGITSTLLAKDTEWLYAFLSMVVVISVLVIISKGAIFGDLNTVLIVAFAMMPLGFLFGKLIGSFIKNKRKAKIQKSISNTPSSQTGTAEQ
jgi:hypothetical protein